MEDSSFQGKKVAKKVWFPFGTSSHEKHAFSDFCHLAGDARLFAESLATSTGVKPEIRAGSADENSPSQKEKRKKNPPKVKINPEMLQDLLREGESKEDLCTKKECQEVIQKILASQSFNKFEREELQEEIDRYLLDQEVTDQDLEKLESKLDSISKEGIQLENTCKYLNISMTKLEKAKQDLQSEKDSISARVIFFSFLFETNDQR